MTGNRCYPSDSEAAATGGDDSGNGFYVGGARSSACPLRCGYDYPIPACVRLHLIQHHDYAYAEAREAYPDA